MQGTQKKSDTPVLISELFYHFKWLAQEAVTENDQSDIDIDINDSSMLSKEITEDEINKCIQKLKNNKPVGIDNIINEYIKNAKHMLCPLYVKLFNKVLETGNIPED